MDETISAFKWAWASREVAAVVLTGAGDRAFCAGGDVKERAETGGYGDTEWGTFEIKRLHRIIRDIPKPVIAEVNGAAIGGGHVLHVLHVLCDLTVAAEHATFGQTGPRVGSFDAGFGSAYLARVVGEKRARQIWFLLEKFDAVTAERWALVNAVVPADELLPTAQRWGTTIGAYSPTALRSLKHSFNADTDHIGGISQLAFDGLDLYAHGKEGIEGARAVIGCGSGQPAANSASDNAGSTQRVSTHPFCWMRRPAIWPSCTAAPALVPPSSTRCCRSSPRCWHGAMMRGRSRRSSGTSPTFSAASGW